MYSLPRNCGRSLPQMAKKVTPISYALLQWLLSLLTPWAGGPVACFEQQNVAKRTLVSLPASALKGLVALIFTYLKSSYCVRKPKLSSWKGHMEENQAAQLTASTASQPRSAAAEENPADARRSCRRAQRGPT